MQRSKYAEDTHTSYENWPSSMNWWPVNDELNEELKKLLFVYALCFAPKVVSLQEVCICSPNPPNGHSR